MTAVVESESSFISRLVGLTNNNQAAFFLKDDVAYLKDQNIIVTTDTTIEGIHILRGLNPKYIAYKAMARSLSDIFGKGGSPVGYFLNIILPSGFTDFDGLIQGFTDFTAIHKIDLLGGDTSVYGNDIVIVVTILAKVEKHTGRFNAQIGDGVYLTKKIGSAFLGFIDCQSNNLTTDSAKEYLMPSLVCIKNFASINASMDISDGLITDATKLANASRKCLEIDFNLLPFADGINLQDMLSFGDDYNILATSSVDVKNAIRIGQVKNGKGVDLKNCSFEVVNKGFDHFLS